MRPLPVCAPPTMPRKACRPFLKNVLPVGRNDKDAGYLMQTPEPMEPKAPAMTVPELLKLASGCWKPCTLHAGVKLDVFSHLAHNPMSAADLARLLEVDDRGLDMLLHALVA